MHQAQYTSTYYTTTKDYRGCSGGTLSRDPPCTKDKNTERHLPGSTDGTLIHQVPGQESAGRFFCVVGTRGKPGPRRPREPTMLRTLFCKLTAKAITPHRATPGSVGYDLFTPIDFVIQPQEQRTIFIDLAVTPPEGYYAQLMSQSGLMVLYKLEVKARVIDPDFTGNIGVVLKNNSKEPVECVAGEQIAQLLFIKVATPILIQVPSLTKTQRGEDGFGAHSAV